MKRKLGDLAIIVKSKDSVEKIDRNKYVTTENMISNRGGVSFPSSTVPKQNKLDTFDKDDVLVSNIRPYFKKIWKAPFSGYKSGDVLAFRTKDRDILSQEYLYILLESDRFFEYMTTTAKGTKMPRGDKKAIAEFPFDLPSIDIQKKRSHQIEVIEQKISLNQQINANLDELMSEIFERYVTEANVFTTDSLSNIANYKNGLAMQRFRPNGADKGLPVLKIKELNQGFTDSSSDRCSSKISNDVIVKTGDIIFSWSGTLIVKIWTGTTCGLNQHLFKVTSDKYPKWFIYKWTEYYLRQFQSIAAGKATTMGHIKRSDLKQAEVKIPHKSEIDRLDKLISPIFKRYVNNILEINSLKELKNELLSKIF